MSLATWSFTAGLVALCAADVSGPKPEPLHPRDYASSDGAWVLHVDPWQRYGAGPARCRMAHRGALAWERELAFTFQRALVATDGTVVGYASTTGIPLGAHEGELVVAVLGPDGVARGVEHEPFVWSEASRPPYPWVDGLELFESRDLVVLTVSDPVVNRYELWSYSLSTGKPLKRVVDDPPRRTGGIACAVSPEMHVPTNVPTLSLAPLAELSFDVPGDSSRPSALRFQCIDALGRVLFVDRKQRTVAAFDRAAKPIYVARFAPQDFVRWEGDVECLAAREARRPARLPGRGSGRVRSEGRTDRLFGSDRRHADPMPRIRSRVVVGARGLGRAHRAPRCFGRTPARGRARRQPSLAALVALSGSRT